MDLPTALSTATAGAIIGVLPGTYTGTNTSDRFSPAWRTTNSGTSGNLIRVVAKYAAAIYSTDVCDMRSGTTTDGAGCPAFGVNLKDYVEWIGFYVDESLAATRPDTGPVVCVASTGSAIRLCHIIGDTAYLPGDNHCGVRVEGTYNCTIADNKIHGFFNSSVSPANGTGIETYTSGNLTVENNTIYDCFTGIHHKADGDDAGSSGDTTDAFKGWFYTRKNLIYDVNNFGIICGRSYDGYDRQITQNIVVVDVTGNDGYGLVTWNYTPDDPRRLKIQNNVFYVFLSTGTFGLGIFHKGQLGLSNQFYNNIVVAPYRAVYQESVGTFTTSYWEPEHNCYYGYASFGDLTGGSGNPLATYQSAYSMDSVSPAAINSDPSFVNTGTRDFHLNGGSPCASLGRDLLNLSGSGVGATIPAGAYISGTETIGVRS